MDSTSTLTEAETAGLNLMLEQFRFDLRLAKQAALLADSVTKEAMDVLFEVCAPYRTRVRTEGGEIQLAANGLCERMRLRFLRIPAWEPTLGNGTVMLQQRGENVYLRMVPRLASHPLPQLCAIDAQTTAGAITYELKHLPNAAPFAHAPLNEGAGGLYRIVGMNLDTMVFEGAQLKLRYRKPSKRQSSIDSGPTPDEASTPTLDMSDPHNTKNTKPARTIPEREQLLACFRHLIQAYETNQPLGPALFKLLTSKGIDYLRPSHGIHVREMLAEVHRSGSWDSEELHLLFDGNSWLDNPWVDLASFVRPGHG